MGSERRPYGRDRCGQRVERGQASCRPGPCPPKRWAQWIVKSRERCRERGPPLPRSIGLDVPSVVSDPRDFSRPPIEKESVVRFSSLAYDRQGLGSSVRRGRIALKAARVSVPRPGETVSGGGGARACRKWETRVREGELGRGVGLDVDAVAVVGEAVDEDDRTPIAKRLRGPLLETQGSPAFRMKSSHRLVREEAQSVATILRKAEDPRIFADFSRLVLAILPIPEPGRAL
jgi:hypothetical protein